MATSDARDALVDMVNSLKAIFKKYDRAARKHAWHSLQVGQGKRHIEQLLDSPGMPVVGIQKWLTFKEWREQREDASN